MSEKAEEKNAATKEVGNSKPTVKASLENLLGVSFNGEDKITYGLNNLNSLPDFGKPPHPVKGKDFVKGVMGFRKGGKGELSLAIACGKAQVRYITLAKYIAMVENLHDPESATIMLHNFQSQDEYKSGRGQVLARINAESSAITVIQGVAGRVVRGPQDIALFDVYYINRCDMTAFYLAAKAQISNADNLETMIQTYDGWKAFDVPLDPLNPYGN